MFLDDRRYQVFVSSTFEDLQEERQKVLQAVLEMKAFPAGMELFPSANEEQWAFIQREIESSDYYIVVIAGKYGSSAEDDRSFTEKEYDYAVGLGKYVMGFLRCNLLRMEGRQLEQDPERKKKLEVFREKVRHNRLVRFYNSPDELKGLVTSALVHAFQFQPQEGWVRAKNARRLEDLEEVAHLQKRVLELQAENAKLSADPTAQFAQGDDAVEWTLQLATLGSEDVNPSRDPALPVEDPQEPPASDFAFSATWNQLLATAFSNADPEENKYAVRHRIVKLIISRIADRFPDASQWATHRLVYHSGIVKQDLDELMVDVRRQFLGLGLIEIAAKPMGDGTYHRSEGFWCLTPKGRLQLLAVSGIRRSRTGPTK